MADLLDPNCLFCKFISGELETDKVFENEDILAFKDIHPQAPTHLLIIPKRHIPTLNAFAPADAVLAGQLMLTAREIAARDRLPGYRVAMNVERAGGQLIFHAHLHMLAGRPLKPELG
jgi:histidine triad (HIT) family protein